MPLGVRRPSGVRRPWEAARRDQGSTVLLGIQRSDGRDRNTVPVGTDRDRGLQGTQSHHPVAFVAVVVAFFVDVDAVAVAFVFVVVAVVAFAAVVVIVLTHALHHDTLTSDFFLPCCFYYQRLVLWTHVHRTLFVPTKGRR